MVIGINTVNVVVPAISIRLFSFLLQFSSIKNL
jgi:hypothetical protein